MRHHFIVPILVASLLALPGCDSEAENGTDTSSDQSASECKPGTADCPCPDGGGCSEGLVCREGLCRESPDDVGPAPDADRDGEAADTADAGLSVAEFLRGESDERLEATDEELGPDFVRELVDSPAADELTHLNLAGNELGDEGARLLADSESLGQLESLDLSDNGIGTAGAEALADVERFESLETLKLADNDLGEKAAETLGDGPLLRSVPRDGHVDLSGHDWSRASRKALGAHGRRPAMCARIDRPDFECYAPTGAHKVDDNTILQELGASQENDQTIDSALEDDAKVTNEGSGSEKQELETSTGEASESPEDDE